MLNAFQKFEEDLLNQMDEPLPFETEEDRRLRRNRLAKHLCNLCYQTINQAIIFEPDLKLTPCELIAHPRSRAYNNPKPLIDSKLPEKVPLMEPSRGAPILDSSSRRWEIISHCFRFDYR